MTSPLIYSALVIFQDVFGIKAKSFMVNLNSIIDVCSFDQMTSPGVILPAFMVLLSHHSERINSWGLSKLAMLGLSFE